MSKIMPFIGFLFLFVGCKNSILESDLSKINGYWEIEKVVFANGNDKEYSVNESYDFYAITNKKGIRKKVLPQLDGSFLVNNVAQNVTISINNEGCFMESEINSHKLKEEIIELNDNELVIKNKEKIEYHYKKAAPITILSDGKKSK
jgi:hypothetical protein